MIVSCSWLFKFLYFPVRICNFKKTLVLHAKENKNKSASILTRRSIVSGRSWDFSVLVVTRVLEDLENGVCSWDEQFCFLQSLQTGSWVQPTSYCMGMVSFFPGVKQGE